MDNHRKTSSTPRPRDHTSQLSMEDRLLREEKRFAEAVLRRTRMLGDIVARRKQERKPGATPDLEKTLWKAWESVLNHEGVGRHRQWRAFLAQCNSLAYALVDQDALAGQKAWFLRPSPATGPVQLPGPACIFSSRVITFWAAVSNAAVTLQGPALNDGLIELIKALNQAGAGLAWDEEAVVHRDRAHRTLDWDKKTFHVGRHRPTLALLLALAIGRPGIVKFSGSSALNLHSLKSWQSTCSLLGARLHQINPHAPGLPARLESSGQPQALHVGLDTPPELLWALAAAAPFYPQGLHLSWPNDSPPGQDFLQILHLLRAFQVPVAESHCEAYIPPVAPILPTQPEIALDENLCALLLAWSRVSRQPMRILGAWPKDILARDSYLDLLGACGLKITQDTRSISATPHKWPSTPVLDVRAIPQALPLAVVLALSAPGEAVVLVEHELCGQDIVEDLLHFTGRACSSDYERHLFSKRSRSPGTNTLPLEAPDAFWGMAMALLSFVRPGLSLANPGELTTLWPRFWQIFHTVLSVPRPKPESQPTEIIDDQPGKQRRRVRI